MSDLSLSNIAALRPTHTSTYEQQTFLGASIVNFNVNAGFGDTSSTLSLELVEDEYHTSDGTSLGNGQDVYHNGKGDTFLPPPAGSPVFFTFGSKRAKVSEAFLKSFDDLYNTSVSTASNNVGHNHFAFAGILQSYSQNKSTSGRSYSVQVVDPRELLSNVQLILNNYSGSTYGFSNIINIYGFLEFNSVNYDNDRYFRNALKTSRLSKINITTGADAGKYYYEGVDMYYNIELPPADKIYQDSITFSFDASSIPTFPKKFPITGTGMSRRGPQGIPYYRIVQAFNAMGGFDGPMPQEYVDAGFAGSINFRGLNYVVDLTGLPKLPQMYFIDYDQINLLDLCLEICDATNRELFVTLLPVIDHRACKALYLRNNEKISSNQTQQMIAGIIKIDAIDKSQPPSLGAIKTYIDNLQNAGVPIENRDVGYELANNVTDKMIVGAQEVDMYYFTAQTDRNQMSSRQSGNQWTLESTLQQQVLPYYGKIGKKAVTIPKGFGSYQQILLDATSLQANGVKTFYVATEMELRAATISFERWSEFLIQYNDIYMESIESDDIRESIAAVENIGDNEPPLEISTNYAVTVPRSVWDTAEPNFDGDLPASTCNPPYGWPLYYKRATQIGLPQAGLASIASVNTKIMQDLALLKTTNNYTDFKAVINSIWKELKDKGISEDSTEAEKRFYNIIKEAIDSDSKKIALIDQLYDQLGPIVAGTERLAQKGIENAKQIYNFLKNIADECLGKKFLVKIPQRVNRNYDISHTYESNKEIRKGPYGFVRRSISKDPLAHITSDDMPSNSGMSFAFLQGGKDNFYGALRVELNPITEEHEFNYTPDNQGGYIEYDLKEVIGGKSRAVNLGLSPIISDDFINENGRMSAYVRFDNSQNLSFENMGKENFTQQVILDDYVIPDVSYQLENSSNSHDKFDIRTEDTSKPKSVAFVKCSVDEKLYMPPKIFNKSLAVYGREVEYKKAYSKPSKIFDVEKCEYKDSFTYSKRIYYPTTDEPGVSANVLCLDPNDIDKDHVYALITLPQKIVPTVTTRYRDSLSETVNAATYKHYLMMDTVQGLEGFDQPTVSTPGLNRNLYSRYTHGKGLGPSAEAAIQKAFENLSFALPNKITVASPSPVYPDLVVLPLRSSERCYGPWLSSYAASDAVGGKIEFVKDEQLAPWNYAGYDNMNAAGKLHAQFGSSCLLTSERGGFVVPIAPSGISLARALLNYGPLVTNISVSVAQAGIKTTFKMDSYTASFGKMQKQVKDMITNISRNRQKQKDEQNAMIRKGIGKNQTNINYDNLYKRIDDAMKSTADYRTSLNFRTGGAATSPADLFVMSVFNKQTPTQVKSESSSASPELYGDTNDTLIYDQNIQEGSMQSAQMLQESTSLINTNPSGFAYKFYNTAVDTMSDRYAATSFDPEHPNMSSVGKSNLDNFQSKDDMNISISDDITITYWKN